MSDQTTDRIRALENRHLQNLSRSNELGSSEDPDRMRMHLVFIHSVFEDTLRQLAVIRLEEGHEVFGKELSLRQIDLRKTKFTIAELVKAYPEKTCVELQDIAVREQIERLTFNNFGEVVAHFERIDLQPKNLDYFRKAIDTGIKRRHKIVHQADIEIGSSEPTPISNDEVRRFLGATSFTIVDAILSYRGEESKMLEEAEFLGSFAHLYQ